MLFFATESRSSANVIRYCFLISSFFFSCISLHAQEKLDTIYTINKTIIGKVREVGDEISYSYSNEDVMYRIKKRTVLSITFSSGRKEVFNTQSLIYQPVKTSADWKQVSLSFIPEEAESMIRLGIVTTKASGITTFSNAVNVQNRAYEKLKQAAAILGGNLVLVNSQAIEGNVQGQRSSRTQLTATVYRSEPLDTAGIYKNLSDKNFAITEESSLGPNDLNPVKISQQGRVLKKFKVLNNLVIRNGVPIVKMAIQPAIEFMITSHDARGFTVAYQHKNKVVEIVFKRVR